MREPWRRSLPLPSLPAQARAVLARNGHTSLIYLRGFATKLAGGRADGSLSQVRLPRRLTTRP